MATMQSWMFLSSYEKMRAEILNNYTIVSMANLGVRGFDSTPQAPRKLLQKFYKNTQAW